MWQECLWIFKQETILNQIKESKNMKLQVAFNFQSQSSLVLFNSAVTVYRQHYGPYGVSMEIVINVTFFMRWFRKMWMWDLILMLFLGFLPSDYLILKKEKEKYNNAQRLKITSSNIWSWRWHHKCKPKP